MKKTSQEQAKKGRNGNPPPIEKGFKKGQSGNPNGRAKKYLTTVTDRTGYKNSEIADCMLSMLKMTVPEITQVSKSKDTPILENLIASAILGDIEKMELRNLDSILNRSYGKVKEHVEVEQKKENRVVILELPHNGRDDIEMFEDVRYVDGREKINGVMHQSFPD